MTITTPNAGLWRTISDWDGATTLTLMSPYNYTVAPGDAFTIYPGCDKQLATCTAFGNQANFRGFAFIPSPESIGSY